MEEMWGGDSRKSTDLQNTHKFLFIFHGKTMVLHLKMMKFITM